MKKKLLIVDDDIDIREMIQKYFEKENYQVTCAENGKTGLDVIKQENFDVVLLDVMMPEMDGYEMLGKLREFSEIPVILLTAKGEQISKIKGFTKGCDDYVVKPFDFGELSLRIQAILKRIHRNGIETNQGENILVVKDLIIDRNEHIIMKSGKSLELTPKEFEILCLLASNKGRVYSTQMIYEMIWEDEFMENDNSVITHIRNLRSKIGDDVKQGTYIKTIWGVGYKIEKEN